MFLQSSMKVCETALHIILENYAMGCVEKGHCGPLHQTYIVQYKAHTGKDRDVILIIKRQCTIKMTKVVF